ncbi:MAG: AbrB/MazE/SpoVT family DNA-binding domain-containing protein [Nitrospirota bacterium]|nr:AbrB/MazE/SpoVT family DNA-binding domain-containing protein [Nitrospirota bacterium]
MQVVKVLPKGQITLPKEVREKLDIKEGDTLILKKTDGEIILIKGKTIFDYAGTLPNLGMSIEKTREKAIEEAAKDSA